MKRPACFAGLWLVLFIGLILKIKPPEPFYDRGIDGVTLKVCGTVSDKYQKNDSYYLILKRSVLLRDMDQSPDQNLDQHPDQHPDQHSDQHPDQNPKHDRYNLIIKLNKDCRKEEDLPYIGDRIYVTGTGMLFDRARNPGNFDNGMYQKIHDMDFEIYDARVTGYVIKNGKRAGHVLTEDRQNCTVLEVSPRGSPGIREYMYRLKYELKTVIERLYDEDDAAIVEAMILGDRNGLDRSIKGMYQRSGISHILCISAAQLTYCGLCMWPQSPLLCSFCSAKSQILI